MYVIKYLHPASGLWICGALTQLFYTLSLAKVKHTCQFTFIYICMYLFVTFIVQACFQFTYFLFIFLFHDSSGIYRFRNLLSSPVLQYIVLYRQLYIAWCKYLYFSCDIVYLLFSSKRICLRYLTDTRNLTCKLVATVYLFNYRISYPYTRVTYVNDVRGPFEQLVDRRKCVAVMQREAVIVAPSCSESGKLLVALYFELQSLEPFLGWRSKDQGRLKSS
jgi:hypothetical protein